MDRVYGKIVKSLRVDVAHVIISVLLLLTKVEYRASCLDCLEISLVLSS